MAHSVLQLCCVFLACTLLFHIFKKIDLCYVLSSLPFLQVGAINADMKVLPVVKQAFEDAR